jgi:hypothetical protein
MDWLRHRSGISHFRKRKMPLKSSDAFAARGRQAATPFLASAAGERLTVMR